MEIGALTPAAVLDALSAAWNEAVQADAVSMQGPEAGLAKGHTLADASAAAQALRGRDAVSDAAPESTATPPELSDTGPRAAAVQTLGRPHAPVLEPLRPADTTLPHASHAGSDFAIPADQLVPMVLTGLQVDALAAWLVQRRPPNGAALTAAPAPRRDDGSADDAGPARTDDRAPDDDGASDDEGEPVVAVPLPPIDDASEREWREPLMRALRRVLAEQPPPALLAAVAQWQRGRCVVLACPQGVDPAGPAWAFVLWPRRIGAVSPATLQGLRVAARLHWRVPPRPPWWCHGRAVKEHHPVRGRQLVAMSADGATVPCEVQLGPVLARPLRACRVSLRVDAVRRFWAALGTQWSVTVVVCSQALEGARACADVETP